MIAIHNDFGGLPVHFIRFNPDSYKSNKKIENLDNKAFYKDWRAINRDTETPYSLNDLTTLEQQGFYLYQAEKHIQELKVLAGEIDNLNLRLVQNNFFDSSHASQWAEQIDSLVKSLVTERRSLAVAHEKLVKHIIETNEDAEVVRELNVYLTHLQLQHDKENLVDRE